MPAATKPRSIAINTRLLFGRLEGMGIHIFEIVQRLVRWHPEVEFHFIFDRAWDDKYRISEQVYCHRLLPPTRHPILINYWYDYRLGSLLKRIKPDLFWSPDNFTCLKTSVPNLLTIHDLAFLHVEAGVTGSVQRLYRSRMPRSVYQSDHILAVSEYTKSDIVEQYGYPADQITVCYNGCRSNFRPTNRSERLAARQKYALGSEYFAYIGSLHPRKNIERLVRGYSLFRQRSPKQLKLVIAGRRAWMTQSIDEAIRSSAYKEDILLLDRYLDEEEAVQFIGGSLALCYVSLFEGFGIPILEGMACSVPVICSNTSSMPEVGGDAVCYVDPLDPESIADALHQIAENPDYRHTLTQKAVHQRAKFGWEKTAKIVEQLIWGT